MFGILLFLGSRSRIIEVAEEGADLIVAKCKHGMHRSVASATVAGERIVIMGSLFLEVLPARAEHTEMRASA